MTAQVSVFIATSLDGYIARKDGSIDWLEDANRVVPEGEDCGYQEFIEQIDVLVMGRNTYEKVMSFGKWPYTLPVVVLSSKPIEFPASIPDSVLCSSESPVELHLRLSNEGARKIYVDGANTIQRFLEVGLVDEIIITTIPILIGQGIPLFGQFNRDILLNHVRTRAFEFGFVQNHYHVDRSR